MTSEQGNKPNKKPSFDDDLLTPENKAEAQRGFDYFCELEELESLPVVTPTDLLSRQHYLDRLEAKYFPLSPAPEGQAVALAMAATEPETAHALHLTATPVELIAVFGVLTGMNKSWFNNAKDTPKLKAALHTPGIGGRKGRPPLYLVFPVMQWLIDPKRRKGRTMEDATGWRLLKNQFPRVYAQYEGYEPDWE